MEVGDLLEYRFVNPKDYLAYQRKANLLLSEISHYYRIPVAEITSQHVIDYFELKYDLNFIFLDVDPYAECFRELGGRMPTREDIRYRGVVKKCQVQFTAPEFCSVASGMTVSSSQGGRYVIYVNQTMPFGRFLFSLMHELGHVFAHLDKNSNAQVYASILSNTANISSDKYPAELQPLEDEANVLASLFLLNDERLLDSIATGKTFDNLVRENYMSGSAIMNRLKNFLVYNYYVPTHEAVRIVLDYRNGYTQGLYDVMFR